MDILSIGMAQKAASIAIDNKDRIDQVEDTLDQYENIFTGDVDESVKAWLDAHPEATTTVEDGSITQKKLDEVLASTITDDIVVMKGEPNLSQNKLWINPSGEESIAIPTYEEFLSLVNRVEVLEKLIRK